jgi:biopolymer transport protein ExbB/TolQ
MFTEFDWIKIASESPAMMALIGCSVVTVGVAVERIYYFWRRRGNPEQTAREVTQRMQRGDVKEALWACQHSAHPVGAAMQVIVSSPVDRPEIVEEQLQVEAVVAHELRFQRLARHHVVQSSVLISNHGANDHTVGQPNFHV